MSNLPLNIASCTFLIACSVLFLIKNNSGLDRAAKIRVIIFLFSFTILLIALILNYFSHGIDSSMIGTIITVSVFIPATLISIYEMFISSKSIRKEKGVEKRENALENFRLYLICIIALSYLLGVLLAIITISESSLEIKGHLFIVFAVIVLMLRLWSDKNFLLIARESPVYLNLAFINLVSSYLAIITIKHIFNSQIWQLYIFSIAALILNLTYSLKDNN